jgi:outer membrane protein, adhesin transport system
MRHPLKTSLTALALASLSTLALAQTGVQPAAATTGLAAAAQKAIAQNPEVTARLNALRAAANEIDVASGAYRPRVDLTASIGRDSDRITSRSPESQSLTRTGLALSATQLLWNGQATRNEVERLGHARLVRYFEFMGATEEAALEAARAYVDVLRFQRLVELAEENYVQHKYVYDQLQTKFKAGVGRGVDSEQANARLALAESNLTTEVANLHDVSARYLRIVGDAPSRGLPMPSGLERGLPATYGDSVSLALAQNPAISASIENVRAAEAQSKVQESAYQPRVEARARTGVGKNFDGVVDQKRDTSIELLMNWNLYNGGSDQARVRQFADQLAQAQDLRDKACRDVRQTVAIAHNDIRKLKDQLKALDRNVLAIEKARDAYRQQFDIGQRSLLDLLNAENELYTAKRAYANAEHDLQIAYARTHAAQQTLSSTLGLTRDNTGNDAAQNWQAASDAAQRCPVVVVEPGAAGLEQLNERARKQSGPAISTSLSAPAVTEAPTAVTPAPAAVATVNERLQGWAQAWSAKDVDAYLSFYAKDFAPARYTNTRWKAERRRLLSKPGTIDVKVADVSTAVQGDTVVTRFTQNYRSSNFNDTSPKSLTWKAGDDGQWYIIRESNR